LKEKEVLELAVNETPTAQCFFLKGSSEPFIIYPNQIAYVEHLSGDISVLTPVKSVRDYFRCKGITAFHVVRTYALGDVLMLVPIIRALKKEGFKVVLRTSRRWAKVLELLEVDVQFCEGTRFSTDYGVNLDTILERDHYDSVFSVKHRCDIYAEVLEIDAERLDWSLDKEKLPSSPDEDYVLFQSAGSTAIKQLQLQVAEGIIRRFTERGEKIIWLGKERLEYDEFFALVAGAKCLICMDSSPLWVSHFTHTPVIALLGATRESERLVKHPLYPATAKAVAMNRLITPPCESCFEQAKTCGGKFFCMNPDVEKLFAAVWELFTEITKESTHA